MYELAIIFVLMLCTGFRVPLPEESVLLVAAYFAAVGAVPWWHFLIVAACGVAAADTLAYARGRGRSQQFSMFAEGREFIKQNGFFAVFSSRFFISSRTIVPFMAGSMKMNRFVFTAASFLSAAAAAFIYVGAGMVGYWLIAYFFPVHALSAWLIIIALVTGMLATFAARSHVLLSKN